MNWNQIGTELLIALLPIFVLVLTTLFSYGVAYIRQRWSWAKQAQTIEQVESMTLGTVVALQQSLVDNLKAANEDGKLTSEEAAVIKQQALATLQKQLTDGQCKVLAAVTADVTTWLSNTIEKAVVGHKLDMSAANPTIVEAAPILEPSE